MTFQLGAVYHGVSRDDADRSRVALERDPLARERAAWNDVPTGPKTRPWSRVVA